MCQVVEHRVAALCLHLKCQYFSPFIASPGFKGHVVYRGQRAPVIPLEAPDERGKFVYVCLGVMQDVNFYIVLTEVFASD